MSLICKPVASHKQWDAFYQGTSKTVFPQSSLFADFNQKMDEQSWILGLYEEEKLIGGAIVLGVTARRGNFLLLPYGPIIDWGKPEQFEILLAELKKLGKAEGYHFIRISPFEEQTKEKVALLKQFGARKSPLHILAEHTYVLDLSKSEEELLASMKKNHRNLIRRCERDGVIVEKHTDGDALERLNSMMDVIEKRHGFTRFSRKFVDTEFETFKKEGKAVIFEATLPTGKVDSSAIILFYGDMACYRHSGSLQINNKLPTPYLVQWRVIQEAKRRGMKWYNFWGVAPEGAKKSHPFYGITHFKKGFGGELSHLVACHDIPLSPRYVFTFLIETLRKWKRGF